MNENKRKGSTRAWRKLRQEILERDEYTCIYCGGRANQVDHISSLQSGGGDERSNLASACQSCNLRKSTKSVERFVQELRKKQINKAFLDGARTPPTPSLSFSPGKIQTPFESPFFEQD